MHHIADLIGAGEQMPQMAARRTNPYVGLGAINRSRAALLGFEGFGLAFTRT